MDSTNDPFSFLTRHASVVNSALLLTIKSTSKGAASLIALLLMHVMDSSSEDTSALY